MSIVTFWSNSQEKVNKTLSMIAVATDMAIEHNYKILVITAGKHDDTLYKCFWEDKKKIVKKTKNSKVGNNINLGENIEGLIRMMRSNKLTAEAITNYTKIIFKDRLEILQGYEIDENEENDIASNYPEVIKTADKYYDLIFVDLNNDIGQELVDKILEKSDLIVANINQRISKINEFINLREEKPILKSAKTVLTLGDYDKNSKYSVSNITRYMGEKNKISSIPYNTLYLEASEEARVPDLFLRLRKISESNENYTFISEIRRTSQNIMYRLQDLQVRI